MLDHTFIISSRILWVWALYYVDYFYLKSEYCWVLSFFFKTESYWFYFSWKQIKSCFHDIKKKYFESLLNVMVGFFSHDDFLEPEFGNLKILLHLLQFDSYVIIIILERVFEESQLVVFILIVKHDWNLETLNFFFLSQTRASVEIILFL